MWILVLGFYFLAGLLYPKNLYANWVTLFFNAEGIFVPKKVQAKQPKKQADDPEELQFKDETNTKWVEEWKKTIKKK